jgi:hypothetical protein
MLAKVVTRVETVDNNASKKDNSEKEKEDSIDEKDEDGDNGDVVSVKEGVNSESDESSVESKDVDATSAKEKKKAALKKAALKKNPKAVSKKRKAVGNSNDNEPIPILTKTIKRNKMTDGSDEDIKVRVEESIVVRDKKGIDKYVKRNNKLDDGTNIAEEHYCKTINYLLNKKTTAEKEISKMRKNQTVDMKDKELKNLNVKMHAWVSQILARNSLKFEIMYPTSVVKCCNR